MRHLAHLALFAAIGPFVACHVARAAEPPKTVSPTVDIEVEDRGPDKTAHVAKFSLSVVDGRAGLKSRDGDLVYDLGVHVSSGAETPHYSLVVKRADRGAGADIDLVSALPQHAGPRVLVGRIERADGRLTTVAAQVR